MIRPEKCAPGTTSENNVILFIDDVYKKMFCCEIAII